VDRPIAFGEILATDESERKTEERRRDKSRRHRERQKWHRNQTLADREQRRLQARERTGAAQERVATRWEVQTTGCSVDCREHPSHVYVLCYGEQVQVSDTDLNTDDRTMRLSPPIKHYVGVTESAPYVRIERHAQLSLHCVAEVRPGDYWDEHAMKFYGACAWCGSHLRYWEANPRSTYTVRFWEAASRSMYSLDGERDTPTGVARPSRRAR
jgi:hypothetical protein